MNAVPLVSASNSLVKRQYRVLFFCAVVDLLMRNLGPHKNMQKDIKKVVRR